MPYQYNLGHHRRSISTTSSDAEEWFNRGLMWLYGFDLELAGRCFREAIKLDDNCAMAYWGLAYSSGIYYNNPWKRMQEDEQVEILNVVSEKQGKGFESLLLQL